LSRRERVERPLLACSLRWGIACSVHASDCWRSVSA
jgi:hypothetical protein